MSIRIAYLPGSVSRLSGGLFTSVRRLSESVADHTPCRTTVIGHRDSSTSNDLQAWQTAPTLLSSSTFVGRCRELNKHLRNQSISLAHPQFLWSYASVATLRFLASNKAARHVVSPRGMLDPWAVRNSRWKKRIAAGLFEQRHLSSAACIHALCESEAKAIRSFGLKNPIAIIPNGMDLPDRQHRTAGRVDQNQILFLGRIHPKKGLRELIQGWAIAKAQLKNWKLVIAGWDDGGHLPGLKEMAIQLDVQDCVEFPGSLYGDAKNQALHDASAFILPSFSEGLPMAVLEAWAYRLPVIMTDFCNLPIGFTANAGIRISPNPESIADGLRDFASRSHDDSTAMGLNGRHLVETDFTWKRIAEDMADVYAWTLGQAARPACVIVD